VLKSQIMDLDLDLTIPCHMDRSRGGYFLLMSPDGLRDYNKESMEDGHY